MFILLSDFDMFSLCFLCMHSVVLQYVVSIVMCAGCVYMSIYVYCVHVFSIALIRYCNCNMTMLRFDYSVLLLRFDCSMCTLRVIIISSVMFQYCVSISVCLYCVSIPVCVYYVSMCVCRDCVSI